ncbi:MAG: hypothetical protein JWR78_5499 [Mycobacterium sp.]|nr:hypothetical protein [Mycobacterium sp.]
MAADHRSALPRVPGIPWWAAATLAATLTAIGVAFDAGSGDNALGGVFTACYVLGCVAAVLAVRQSGVFTAVIQPPLILFIAVPFAYFVFHGSTFTGIKDTLINCGYPLIERFPLMFFTSATVLLIGMVRWYLGAAARRATPKDAEPTVDVSEESPAATKVAATGTKTRRKTRSATARAAGAAAVASAAGAVQDEPPRTPRRPRTAATGSQRSTGAAAGTGSRRSRHARPPETEAVEPVPNRPRKRTTAPVDPPAEPRRRPRSGEPREREPRESRERRPLPPLDRRSSARERPERDSYERPARRGRPEGYERTERPDRAERPQRRSRSEDYEPYEPPASRTTGSNGTNGTHHPVSRVRYRGAEDGESRTEHRTRARRPRHSAPDSWEYDV